VRAELLESLGRPVAHPRVGVVAQGRERVGRARIAEGAERPRRRLTHVPRGIGEGGAERLHGGGVAHASEGERGEEPDLGHGVGEKPDHGPDGPRIADGPEGERRVPPRAGQILERREERLDGRLAQLPEGRGGPEPLVGTIRAVEPLDQPPDGVETIKTAKDIIQEFERTKEEKLLDDFGM
jgi:hypothetical protein